jgi:hypothetical protein
VLARQRPDMCAEPLRQAQDGALRQAQDGALRQAQDGALRQAQDGACRSARLLPFDRLRAQVQLAGVHMQIGREAFSHFNDLLKFRMPDDDHSVTDQDGAPVAPWGTDWEQVHHHDVVAILS